MQSNGGLIEASKLKGKNLILSGPAGGVVGAIETSMQYGRKKIICFDMGGTYRYCTLFGKNGIFAQRQKLRGFQLWRQWLISIQFTGWWFSR